jgi:WD40 repeat protein
VRRWDVETGIAIDTLNSGNAVYAVATAAQDSTGVVAFGGAERALRLWDSRARGTENLVRSGVRACMRPQAGFAPGMKVSSWSAVVHRTTT